MSSSLRQPDCLSYCTAGPALLQRAVAESSEESCVLQECSCLALCRPLLATLTVSMSTACKIYSTQCQLSHSSLQEACSSVVK